MKIFNKKVLHHFKVCFPIPLEKVQNCLKKIQTLNLDKTSAVCLSLNGHTQSPENCQLLYESLLNTREVNKLSVFTFLESRATALTYFTATAGQSITMNPYSMIGDIATPQKSYRNIKKLLDLLGIKYEQLGSKHESSTIWNQFAQQTQRQKEITHKWLQLIQNNMIQSIHTRRKIPKENLVNLKSKIMHPREALKHKLVDSIGTFEEFAELNFPNHTVQNFTYRIEGTRVSTLSHSDINAICHFFDMLAMPQVPLMTSEDPLLTSMNQLISLIELKFQTPEQLDSLELWLQSFLNEVKGEQPYRGLTFQI